MDEDDWLGKEMDAIEAQYQSGALSAEEYLRQAREILRDADEMAARITLGEVK